MGYAVTTDLDQILAKLPVASGVLRQGFLDAAEAEIHAACIGIYEVPIEVPSSVATTISGVTIGILKSIQQDLAAGQLLLSLATSTENDTIHARGENLVNGAFSKLEDIKTQKLVLPGATKDSTPNDDKPRPCQVSYSSPDGKDVATDLGSFYNRPYEQVANPNNETVGGPDIND